MVMLYVSRKMGWLLAVIFAAVAVGLYFYPSGARPIVGATVSLGDRVAGNILDVVKHILS